MRTSSISGVLILSLGVLSGCGGLRLGDVLGMSAASLIYQTSGLRPSTSSESLIVPPLTRVWEEDVSAGVGNDPPVILDSIILIGTLRGELHALHIESGKKLGWVGLGNAITGSPALRGTIAYVGLAGSKESLIAYDFLFGKTVWTQTAGDIEGTPLLINGKLYVGNTAGTFSCIDCEEGHLRWKFDLPLNATVKGIRGSATGDSATVFFGADDGGVYALNAVDGTQRWRRQMDAPIQAPVVLDTSRIYVSTIHGTVAALDATSGTQLWSYDLASPIYAPVRSSAGKAIVCSTSGAVVALDGSSGSLLWKYVANGPINAAPLVAGDYLIVGTLKKELLVLDKSTGTVVWTGMVNGRIKTAPVASFGRLIVATDEPMIIAFRGIRP